MSDEMSAKPSLTSLIIKVLEAQQATLQQLNSSAASHCEEGCCDIYPAEKQREAEDVSAS